MSHAYAIVGARIAIGADVPTDSSVLVVRDGVIDAVGVDVTVPVDAQRLEGEHLTVYPGLIDLGNARLVTDGPVHPPQDLTTLDKLAEWKQLQYLSPHVRAADTVRAGHPVLTTWGAAGVTSLLALPSAGVIAGQSALIDAVGPAPRSPIGMVVGGARRPSVARPSVALHVSFPECHTAHGIAYPASEMGMVAFARQAFVDAQRYARTRPRHCRAADGDSDADDPRLEAMRDVVERRMPVVFEANTPADILRALRIAREHELDPIVLGGREADQVATELASGGVPVIYSLNYPVRPSTLAPDGDESLRTLRSRVRAPGVPAALARAGVRFAFASAGLTDPAQFIANAAKAIEAGLSRHDALHALTAGAAAIAREPRLGTIARGQIANLVIATGDLFEEQTVVAGVFVRGTPVLALPHAAPASERAGTSDERSAFDTATALVGPRASAVGHS